MNTTIEKIQLSYTNFNSYLSKEFDEQINLLDSKIKDLDREKATYLGYLQNNRVIINRTLNSYSPSTKMKDSISAISKPIDIYIIMENWCGSSAGNVPYIVKLLQENPLITINIVPRDANLNYTDLYLTNGKRSIPKVIAYNETGKELFVWGSASKMQAEFAATLQAQNLDFQDFVKEMQAWFKENNAIAIERDFIEIFENL